MPFAPEAADVGLDDIDIHLVDDNGGMRITLLGNFLDEPALIDVGVGGVWLPCYSGIIGRGSDCKPTADDGCVFVVPPLTRGITYDLRFRQTGVDETMEDILDVEFRQWHSRVFSLRALAPPHLWVGPRAVEDIDPLT